MLQRTVVTPAALSASILAATCSGVQRIHFDANEGDEPDRFDLGIPGSLCDIKNLPTKLTHGMRVICCDDQEFEVEAILERDAAYGHWMAKPLWDTMQRLSLHTMNPAGAK